MTKRDIIMQIRSAKAAHIRWKSFVQISLRGIVTQDSKVDIPIVQTECDFGNWYYGDGMILSMIPGYMAIEEPHEMVHEIYIQIYTLQKATFKGGFFTSERKFLKKREEEVNRLSANFSDYVKILVEAMNQLEIDVLKLQDEEIESMMG